MLQTDFDPGRPEREADFHAIILRQMDALRRCRSLSQKTPEWVSRAGALPAASLVRKDAPHSGIDPEALERLLDAVRVVADFDFRDYTRPCLSRCVAHQMGRLGITDIDAYAAHLRRSPAESEVLCQAIWINVTDFFRDTAVWQHLRAQVIPQLLAGCRSDAPLRIWSAGSASGQEAYSLAMLLAEALDPAGSDPSALAGRVEILGTDVDGEALAFARRGIYPDHALAAVPSCLREKHWEPAEGGGRVCDALRRAVRFRRHNLLRERQRETFDLIVCRNTLIYFQPEAQRRVLASLHRALAAQGYLLLGRAEVPIFHNQNRLPAERLAPANLRTHLYQRS